VRAIDLVIRILPQSQTEEVWFRDDEIQVLVVYLRNVLCSARGCYLRGKVFEQRPRYRGQEVHVGGRVEAARQVRGDEFDVGGSRFDEIDDGHIGDRVSSGIDVSAVQESEELPNKDPRIAHTDGS